MNKSLYKAAALSVAAFICLGFVSSCGGDGKDKARHGVTENDCDSVKTNADGALSTESLTDDQMKIFALKQAYPDMIADVKDNKVIFTDGSTITYDDGKKKDAARMLDDADVEDMFATVYALPEGSPAKGEDTGRSRSEALYKKMYGSSASEVQRNLTSVDWAGDKVQFTSVNGGADSLRAVAKEVAKHPELQRYLKSSGTFYWRPVRGAKRLSAHSYGIAFDIAVSEADYWQWNAKTNDETADVKYANKIPRQLVEIFQRHGFIWGGAWYHYDTMHFEFRPELLKYADMKSNS